MKKRLIGFLTVLIMLALMATFLCLPAGASDTVYYLRLDGIEGVSTDADHLNWIEVFNFQLGSAEEASDSEHKIIQKIYFTHLVDKATPAIQNYLKSGEVIPSGEVDICSTADGKTAVIQHLQLKEITIIDSKPGTQKTDSSMDSVEEITLCVEEQNITVDTIGSDTTSEGLDSQQPAKEKDYTDFILIGVCGGAVVILIIAAVIVALIRKNKKQPEKVDADNGENNSEE